MKNLIIFCILFLFVSGIKAQWTDNGTNLTTTDNVGIGTTSPDSKLTVEGHVNIGGNGNYHLKVRHVDGKDYDSNSLSDLFLNYNNGKNVRVGFGNVSPQSNLYLAGRLGIGFTSPTHHIDVLNDIDPTEAFLRFRVKDALSDYLAISNATSAAGQFIPVIKGNHVTDNRYSIQFMGIASSSNDTGSTAVVNFDARYSNGPVLTRPLFVWTSYTTKMMTMLANGDVGIGTSSPDAKLAVNGNIHTKEVKVDLVGWPDYVFEKDYDLPTLEEVENHIKTNGHLKDIPSAKEVKENGVLLGEMDSKLLQKIEELTLYTIQQQKEIQLLKQENKKLQSLSERLEQVESLLGQKE